MPGCRALSGIRFSRLIAPLSIRHLPPRRLPRKGLSCAAVGRKYRGFSGRSRRTGWIGIDLCARSNCSRIPRSATRSMDTTKVVQNVEDIEIGAQRLALPLRCSREPGDVPLDAATTVAGSFARDEAPIGYALVVLGARLALRELVLAHIRADTSDTFVAVPALPAMIVVAAHALALGRTSRSAHCTDRLGTRHRSDIHRPSQPTLRPSRIRSCSVPRCTGDPWCRERRWRASACRHSSRYRRSRRQRPRCSSCPTCSPSPACTRTFRR